jgi:hypothetical protein
MALRICLVTPSAWSQRQDVNEHVGRRAGAARARPRGDDRRVLEPRCRSRGRTARAAENGALDGDLLALGPAVAISRRSRVGVPVGVCTNLTLALEGGRHDVVNGFEPVLPSLFVPRAARGGEHDRGDVSLPRASRVSARASN